MKITHFSTYDAAGGAARAAQRLHHALVGEGIDSRLVVLRKSGSDPRCERVVPSNWWNEARLELTAAAHNALKYRYRADEAFTYDLTMLSAPTSGLVQQATGAAVINLHWTRELLTSGQARTVAERTGAAVVMTLMDLAALTGGCHYTIGCTGYQRQCGRCPRLRSDKEHDRSRATWLRRRRNYAATPLTLVACNRWTRDRAHESSLLGTARCEVIPLAIDTELFRPIPKAMARYILGVRPEARVIFCGALQMGQTRKGEAQLLEALRRLPAAIAHALRHDQVLVLTAGAKDFAADADFPLPTQHLGLLGDDRSLALAYSAADVFVSASLEDAGPMMVNEALACGTPVAAFEIGTAADFVVHGNTGGLAPRGDAAALSRAIADILLAPDAGSMTANCRRTAVNAYSPAVIARRYRALYEELAACGRAA